MYLLFCHSTMPSSPPYHQPAVTPSQEQTDTSLPPVSFPCDSPAWLPASQRPTSKPAGKQNGRTWTPLKRYVPETDPHRPPDHRSDNRWRRDNHHSSCSWPCQSSSSRSKGPLALTKLSASGCSIAFYMNRQNSSWSSDSRSTVTVDSNQLHQGQTPNYNQAEWDVLTDVYILDTA